MGHGLHDRKPCPDSKASQSRIEGIARSLHNTIIMSETLTGDLDVMRFEHNEQDVTCCLERLCCGNTKLIMGADEVELNTMTCCGICNSKKRGRKYI